MTGLPSDWNCADKNVVEEEACNKPWAGLTCGNNDNATAVITAISLSGLQSGTVPGEMGLLSKLERLTLKGSLSGPLPPEFNSLSSLVSLDITGSGISGGCFPTSLINNEIFRTCSARDTSFYCSCDAPPNCHSKPCCPSAGGLEGAGLVCENGEWTVPDGKTLSIGDLTLQLNKIEIQTNITITERLEIRSASFGVNGYVFMEGTNVVIAGLVSNFTITKCITIGKEGSENGTTLTLQILSSDEIDDSITWEFLRVDNDCIQGNWKEIIVESDYGDCLLTDTENVTHPGSIILSVKPDCSTGFPTQAILGIVFGLIVFAIVCATIFYIYNDPEAYEYVFPGQTGVGHHKLPEYA